MFNFVTFGLILGTKSVTFVISSFLGIPMFFPFGNRLFQKSSRLHERSLNKQGDCTMTVLEKEGIALEVLDKNRVATPCSGQPWARLWDQFWEFCVFMSCWCRFWHRFRYHV